MTVNFLPAQVDCTSSTTPLPYTGSPTGLLWSDIKLFFYHIFALPSIVVPLGPWDSGALDELYPSLANLYAISLHAVLIVAQSLVLLSIPICLCFPIPLSTFVMYIIIVYLTNHYICLLLNGKKPTSESLVELDRRGHSDKHEREQWIFLNGVAVGYYFPSFSNQMNSN